MNIICEFGIIGDQTFILGFWIWNLPFKVPRRPDSQHNYWSFLFLDKHKVAGDSYWTFGTESLLHKLITVAVSTLAICISYGCHEASSKGIFSDIFRNIAILADIFQEKIIIFDIIQNWLYFNLILLNFYQHQAQLSSFSIVKICTVEVIILFINIDLKIIIKILWSKHNLNLWLTFLIFLNCSLGALEYHPKIKKWLKVNFKIDIYGIPFWLSDSIFKMISGKPSLSIS